MRISLQVNQILRHSSGSQWKVTKVINSNRAGIVYMDDPRHSISEYEFNWKEWHLVSNPEVQEEYV